MTMCVTRTVGILYKEVIDYYNYESLLSPHPFPMTLLLSPIPFSIPYPVFPFPFSSSSYTVHFLILSPL